jgi:hypothetical protein
VKELYDSCVECAKLGQQIFTKKSESVVSDDLVQSADQKVCEKRRFTISELSCEFTPISRHLLYDIVTIRLGYQKFRSRWVPKILTGAQKTQRTASALIF